MFLMSIMMVSYIFIRFQSKIIKVYEKHAFFMNFYLLDYIRQVLEKIVLFLS